MVTCQILKIHSFDYTLSREFGNFLLGIVKPAIINLH